MLNLRDLVKSALSDANQQLKLASAQDVVLEQSKIAMPEGMEYDDKKGEDDEKDEKSKKKKDDDEDEEKTSGLDIANHSMKLAEALDHVGGLWTKMANAMPTFEGQHNVGDTTQHTRTSPATVPAAQAGSGGGSAEASQGHPGGIETNDSEFKTPEWKGNPEARRGAIRTSGTKPGEGTKNASAAHQSALLGQFKGKFAADPSSPQATGLGGSKNPGKLDMVPPNPTEIPDNKGMASMTKKKAKTDHVKGDAAKVIREPAFSKKTDKGISDNLAQDGGNKLSSVQLGAGRALLAKVAAAEGDPHASPQMRVKVARFRQSLDRINQKRQG